MSKENVKVYEKIMMYTISYQNIQGYTFDINTPCSIVSAWSNHGRVN